jgi:hypothetical protein
MHKLQENYIVGPLECGHLGKDAGWRIRESYVGRKKSSCVYFWYQFLRMSGIHAFLALLDRAALLGWEHLCRPQIKIIYWGCRGQGRCL